MIQFLKNIWYAQENARSIVAVTNAIRYMESVLDCDAVGIAQTVVNQRDALHIIASSNPKNTNGTVRKHVRIARDALGCRR